MLTNCNCVPDVKCELGCAPATFLLKRGGGIGAIAAPALVRVAVAQSWRSVEGGRAGMVEA
jgi:hypothetical protein